MQILAPPDEGKVLKQKELSFSLGKHDEVTQHVCDQHAVAQAISVQRTN
jgi:hypothetical protein